MIPIPCDQMAACTGEREALSKAQFRLGVALRHLHNVLKEVQDAGRREAGARTGDEQASQNGHQLQVEHSPEDVLDHDFTVELSLARSLGVLDDVGVPRPRGDSCRERDADEMMRNKEASFRTPSPRPRASAASPSRTGERRPARGSESGLSDHHKTEDKSETSIGTRHEKAQSRTKINIEELVELGASVDAAYLRGIVGDQLSGGRKNWYNYSTKRKDKKRNFLRPAAAGAGIVMAPSPGSRSQDQVQGRGSSCGRQPRDAGSRPSSGEAQVGGGGAGAHQARQRSVRAGVLSSGAAHSGGQHRSTALVTEKRSTWRNTRGKHLLTEALVHKIRKDGVCPPLAPGQVSTPGAAPPNET